MKVYIGDMSIQLQFADRVHFSQTLSENMGKILRVNGYVHVQCLVRHHVP